MDELVTIPHPVTGKPITMLRSLAEGNGNGLWANAPGLPISDEEKAWVKKFTNKKPLRDLRIEDDTSNHLDSSIIGAAG